MTDIDELERLARAATPDAEWFSAETICYDLLADENDAAYISAANPSAVLELIGRLKAAEQDAARWRHARQHLAIEDIEGWAGWVGHLPDEEESRKADAAIDAALAKAKGEQP